MWVGTTQAASELLGRTHLCLLTPGSVGLWKGFLEAAVAWATVGGVHKSSHLFISGNPLS